LALPNYFRFHDGAERINRWDYTYSEYIGRMVAEFEANRPVAYRIEGHAVVADGYDEVIGSYYIHIVYGWNGDNDGWWGIGEIPDGGPTSDHYYVRRLVPEGYVYADASGYYDVPEYPYRYFSQDLHIDYADLEFAAGQAFQILRSGFLLETVETGGGLTTQFHGAAGAESSFYLYGDPAAKTRIRIKDGTLKFHEGGQMVIH
jgi:hypothetical protein